MKITDLTTVSTSTIEAIISRREILQLINNNVNMSNLVLISVSDPVSQLNIDEQLTDIDVSNFKDSLRVKFFDIEEDFLKFTIISDEIAKKIQDFILKNINEVFIINCMDGQSRSAAIGKAIECIKYFGIGEEAKYHYKTGFNSEISQHSRYFTNLTVFDKIVKQY